ncbi:hypothetical protein RUM44_008283 [Polyplax serrata]|uniref:Uncharacterized protein n=1 Tax=Polyplax serrata TaxID=468196 RepID=A0ABR1B7Z8_POLSC
MVRKKVSHADSASVDSHLTRRISRSPKSYAVGVVTRSTPESNKKGKKQGEFQQTGCLAGRTGRVAERKRGIERGQRGGVEKKRFTLKLCENLIKSIRAMIKNKRRGRHAELGQRKKKMIFYYVIIIRVVRQGENKSYIYINIWKREREQALKFLCVFVLVKSRQGGKKRTETINSLNAFAVGCVEEDRSLVWQTKVTSRKGGDDVRSRCSPSCDFSNS